MSGKTTQFILSILIVSVLAYMGSYLLLVGVPILSRVVGVG